MKKEITKIIPDWEKYYLTSDVEQMTSEDIVGILEHEIDLYNNWKEEGFKDKQKVSYINKHNIRKVKGLLTRYYNGNVE